MPHNLNFVWVHFFVGMTEMSGQTVDVRSIVLHKNLGIQTTFRKEAPLAEQRKPARTMR